MSKRFWSTAFLLVMLLTVASPQGASARVDAGREAPSAAVSGARVLAATTPELRFHIDEDTVEISGAPSDTTLTVTLGSGGIHKDLRTGASGGALVSAEDLGVLPVPLLYSGEPVSIVIGGVTVTRAVVQDIDVRVDTVRDRVDGSALAPDGAPLAGRAFQVKVLDDLGDEVANKSGVVSADGSFSLAAGIDLVPGQSVETRVWHRAGGVTTGDCTVRLVTIPIATTLTLSAKKASSAYGAPVGLSAKLLVGGKTISDPGDPDDPFTVGLLQSYDGADWTPAGTLDWDDATKAFVGTRLVTQAVKFRAFIEHTGYRGSASGLVSLTSQASLSQPFLSSASPKRNTKFTVTGYLKPAHSGSALVVYVYRRVGTKWVQFSKAAVAGAAFGTGTKHVLTLSLPTAGQWQVVTYHADKSHLATWSKATAFTVRP